MRSKTFTLVAVCAALTGTSDLGYAQSAYAYPWCSQLPAAQSDATTCYFNTYQQCMMTISGIGGYCYQSPYYHSSAATNLVKSHRPRHR
jgi:hypothetical protein